MKVFLSWSGIRSHVVAEALRDWLPDILNEVEPFLSSDIEKGARGMEEIASSLRDCSFGIVCLTPDNQQKPWINYEAGALSKAVGDDPARVATLLIGMKSPAEVTGPLASFQATMLSAEDMKRLIFTVNRHTGRPRPEDKLADLVDTLYYRLEGAIESGLAWEVDPDDERPTRSADDKLDEVLSLVRELSRIPLANPVSLKDQLERSFGFEAT